MTYQLHRFDPTVAKLYGLSSALIFHYLYLRCGNPRGTFVALSLDEIAANYPYLGRTTVSDALKRLTVRGGAVKRKRIDGVNYYCTNYHDPAYRTYAFDVSVALEHGVVPAIILTNIRYWVKLNWKRKAEELLPTLYPKMIPDYVPAFQEALNATRKGAAFTTTVEGWGKHHEYLSSRTIRRGISCLLKAKLLKKRPGKYRQTIYCLDENSTMDFSDLLLSLSELDQTKTASAAKSEHQVAKSERQAAKSEQKPGLSCCPAEEYDTPIIHIEYNMLNTATASPPPSLTLGVARSASIRDFALRAARKLNQPGYCRQKKRFHKKSRQVAKPKEDFSNSRWGDPASLVVQ